MKPVACLGDTHVCPAHGTNAIISTTSAAICNGKQIAVVGDVTACGATILPVKQIVNITVNLSQSKA